MESTWTRTWTLREYLEERRVHGLKWNEKSLRDDLSNMPYHYDRQHGEKSGKNLKCDSCSIEFFVRSRLEHHQKTHDTIKEYLCEFCNKDFSSQISLQSHKLHMHKETGQAFFCTHCNKAFTTRRQFTQHTNKLHKKLTCVICGMKVSSQMALKNHKKSTRCALPIQESRPIEDSPFFNPDDPPVGVMEF